MFNVSKMVKNDKNWQCHYMKIGTRNEILKSVCVAGILDTKLFTNNVVFVKTVHMLGSIVSFIYSIVVRINYQHTIVSFAR